jgi:nondiscriminating aspartyl-tRNA synthetase
MERTKISNLSKKSGETVLIKGWIHEIRDQSKIKFVLIRDISGIIQTIILKENNKIFEKISELPKESVVQIIGEVKNAKITNPEVSEKEIELKIKEIEILNLASTVLPLQVVQGKDLADLSTRLDSRWIDLRKPQNSLIFKIWTTMEKGMREWWDQNGFIQIYSPKLMSAPSETGAELFEVPYFGKTAYLAQSPQFYKQMAMAAGFEKIFEIGPVFRANPSHTSRHDTEFTMIDMEISFIESDEDIRKVEESWIQHTLKKIKEEFGEEIKKVFNMEIEIPTIPFPRITMEEAITLLKEKNHICKDDLDAEGEKLMSEIIKEKYSHDFVFITEYPWSIRPFYHMKKDKNTTKSFDLLWRGLEITTGAQREHRIEILKKQAVEKGLSLDLIKDYLKFFEYGCPPHGGFGLSPTRMLMLLLGIKNVRDVTFLPRDTSRLTP